MLASRVWALLPAVLTVLGAAFAVVVSLHAILRKRDPRAAVAWAGLIWLVPFAGGLFYLLFGVNRIARRAGRLRRRRKIIDRPRPAMIASEEEITRTLSPAAAHLTAIAPVAERLTRRPILAGNRVTMLVNGEDAYPEMIQAIDQASRSIALEMYLIEYDEIGRRFVDALIRARSRGCEVRVLLDYVGSRMSVVHALRAGGVEVAVFLPPVLAPFRSRYMNLRNHRKILVCDGRIGFTGGMNIRRSHLVAGPDPWHEQDTHFKLEGPVSEHLLETVADDWAFVTGEILAGPAWSPTVHGAGAVFARGIPFDPGEHLDVLRLVVGAAVAAARRSLFIVSPYFVPEQALITELNVAALRGVQVDILIPSRSDSRLVQWATRAMLWQVLINGCRVWLTPEPFDHSKLMLVDDAWVFFGSANMDSRSMRLNFEFNVECYDPDLASTVGRHIRAKKAQAREVTLAEVDGRGLPVRIRDGFARLFAPYL